MDQHPIPQDVTGFQFKLIGSMTVKQFGYVAVGIVAAVILYYLPLNSGWGILAKVFLIPLFGASGIVIAFVPIEGRPIDVMAANFSKALFSPNQYVYHKTGRRFLFSAITTTKVQPVQEITTTKKIVPQQQKLADERSQKLQALLLSSQGRVKNDLDKKEMAFLKSFSPPAPSTIATGVRTTTPIAATHVTQKPPITHPAPVAHVAPQGHVAQPQTPAPVQIKPVEPTHDNPSETTESLAQKEAAIEQQLETAKKEEAAQPATAPAAHQKVVELEKQMTEIHQQKEHLEQELARLKMQLAGQAQPASVQATPAGQIPVGQPVQSPTPTNVQTQPVQQSVATPSVRNIPQGMNKKAGLPHVSDTPNVVVGIVKDSRGNVLPNMLVEVKDKDGNPVRAFKTNPLGQFASATPLAAGTYTIELEDPKKQHSFDIIQITANNQILLPIEITSHDAREALRQQLFN